MKLKSFLFVLLFLSSSSPLLWAQSKEETIKKYILSIEKKHRITFSYDSDLLEEVPFSYPKDTVNFDLKKSLEYLAEKSAFQLQYINDSVIVVRPEQEGANYKLQGKIIDKETKEPLIGCSIGNTTKTFVMISDDNGVFSKYIRYNKNDTLVFNYMGYKTISVPISSVTSGASFSVDMKEEIIETDEIAVTAYLSDGIRFNRLNNSIRINPKDLTLLPGQTDSDLLLSLDALPGINTPDSKAGNLNIRGSSADQTLITFDNIPIYHKGHYFGTLSPFNPKVVENLNVSRSSFTAEKGGRVGGAIDIRTRQAVPDSTLSGISLSTIDGSAYTSIPIVKKRLGILLAGRTSYPNSWMSPKLKSISSFVFQATDLDQTKPQKALKLDEFLYKFYDWNAKIIAQPTDKQTISVSFLKIFNRLDAKINNTKSKTLSYDSIGLNNWGLSAQWTSQWSKKINSTIGATKSYFKQDYISNVRSAQKDTSNGKTEYDNIVNDLDLLTEINFTGQRKNFLKVGYDMHFHDISFQNTRFIPSSSLVNFSNANKGFIHSLFSSYNLISHKKLRGSIGARGNYFTLTQQYNIEPRLSINYLLNDVWTLKSSMGIQKQFITQVSGLSIETLGLENMLWVMADGKGIPVIQSSQVMAGLMYEKKGWLIDLEGYYKIIQDITVINITNFSSNNSFFHGKSNTIGMDVLMRKSWKNFDTWVSYTLSRSMMSIDSIQSTPFPSLADQRHIVDIAGSYKWRQWKFSAGWKYRTGLAALIGIRTKLLHGAPPANQNNSANPSPGGKPTNESYNRDDDGNPFYENRYPSFHQLDASIAYLFPKKQKQWNGSLGLSFANVYNQKNIIEQFHIRNTAGEMVLVSRYSIGFAPNLILSVNF